jgi:hypothetical protein
MLTMGIGTGSGVSKKKRYYAVTTTVSQHPANVQGVIATVTMSWADGMVGVLPVFSSRRAAKKYNPKADVIELVEKGAADGNLGN